MNLNQTLQEKYPHLEVSVLTLNEVQKDNENKRIDSEYFKKEYLENEEIIKNLKSIQLKDVDITIKHPAEIERNYIENDMQGIWFFRTQNLRPLFVDSESNKVFISQDDAKKLNKNIIHKDDILITRTGANYGDCAIYQSCELAIASSHVLIVRSDFFNQSFLSVFLNTKYGKTQISKGVYGGLQPEIAPCYLKNIYVPIIPMEFQLEIEKMVKDSYQALESSKALYKEAEVMLYNELGLNPNNPLDFLTSKSPNISIRTLEDSFLKTGRLDSEYYQEKYDLIEAKIKSYKGGYERLKDIGNFTNGSFIPENFYVKWSKRAYIRIKELSLNSPIKIQDCIYIDDSFQSNNEITVKENDFVIATIGATIGKLNLIPKELDNSFISNNTSKFQLVSKNYLHHFLELLLRSVVVQEQIQKELTQTAQPKISNISLENIFIPKIDSKIQENIKSKIKQSFELRNKSKALLESAKNKVETMIESAK